MKSREFPYLPHSRAPIPFPITISLRTWYTCYSWWPVRLRMLFIKHAVNINWSPQLPRGSLCRTALGLTDTMSCACHYSVSGPLCSFVHSHPPTPQSPRQPLLTVSIMLFFPECHVVGIIQYVVFSDWLLSLSNMLLRFRHVFFWLDSLFLFREK